MRAVRISHRGGQNKSMTRRLRRVCLELGPHASEHGRKLMQKGRDWPKRNVGLWLRRQVGNRSGWCGQQCGGGGVTHSLSYRPWAPRVADVCTTATRNELLRTEGVLWRYRLQWNGNSFPSFVCIRLHGLWSQRLFLFIFIFSLNILLGIFNTAAWIIRSWREGWTDERVAKGPGQGLLSGSADQLCLGNPGCFLSDLFSTLLTPHTPGSSVSFKVSRKSHRPIYAECLLILKLCTGNIWGLDFLNVGCFLLWNIKSTIV